jgi:phosphoadenosine phosphosulfate reductase
MTSKAEFKIIPELTKKLERWPIEQILIWVCHTFGSDVVATSSFQSQSLPLLHMISKYCPELPVLFIDTGYHFPETLAYRNILEQSLDLNIITIESTISRQEFEVQHGKLYQVAPDFCCHERKVIPLNNALKGYKAWISGIRHDQTELRNNSSIIEHQGSIIKINPMINWTQAQVDQYIDDHNLPRHPLEAQGYKSISCYPCTQTVYDSQSIRTGRWVDHSKTECGIHSFPMSTSIEFS